MLDITFYKKQNNDNFVPCTIELCDEDYKKLIVSNFAKRFHSEKQCLIVAFKTFQECYRFVYLLVHHNIFFNKRYLVAVGFQELFDVGG